MPTTPIFAQTLTSAASTAAFLAPPSFVAILRGNGVGTVKLQRSYDNGANWNDVVRPGNASLVSYTKTATDTFTETIDSPDGRALWRFTCSAYTSGNLVCEAAL